MGNYNPYLKDVNELFKEDLEKELSLQVKNVRQIGVTLECFDEKWSEIEECVNEKALVEEEGPQK